jgi:riboflavin kinase/FMN adenylyltransferase
MIVVRHASLPDADVGPCVVALGEFDGVHRGHQAVLQRVVGRARAASSTALIVAGVRPSEPTLGALRQRVEQIGAFGVDQLRLLHGMPPHASGSIAAMIERLPRTLVIRRFVTGASDVGLLDAARHGWAAEIEGVPMATSDGEPVRSAVIRSVLARGDLTRAERMLGRPYAVAGRVVHGVHRGRRLGFPTANLRVRRLQVPPNGVYAVRVRMGANWYDGVANLGFNPTFGNSERSLETHIFDLDADLYGQRIEVTFVTYLRGEQKFAGIDALVEQIRSDVAAARRLLS